MCGGPERSYRPRHGALVVLRATDRSFVDADLIFHTPGQPTSIEATHATLTVTGCDVAHMRVVIHISGDLSRPVDHCGIFCDFNLPNLTLANNVVQVSLEEPLSLAVGDSGIIGRRVSLCSRSIGLSHVVMAEGIVGFNVG